MHDKELIELQAHLTYQDDLIESLNQIVIEQGTRIGKLEDICQFLLERLREMSEQMPAGERSGHEPPPHY